MVGVDNKKGVKNKAQTAARTYVLYLERDSMSILEITDALYDKVEYLEAQLAEMTKERDAARKKGFTQGSAFVASFVLSCGCHVNDSDMLRQCDLDAISELEANDVAEMDVERISLALKPPTSEGEE